MVAHVWCRAAVGTCRGSYHSNLLSLTTIIASILAGARTLNVQRSLLCPCSRYAVEKTKSRSCDEARISHLAENLAMQRCRP